MWCKMLQHLNGKSILILLLIFQFPESVKWGFKDPCWFPIYWLLIFPILTPKPNSCLPSLNPHICSNKNEYGDDIPSQSHSVWWERPEMGWNTAAKPSRNPPQAPWMNSTRKHRWKLSTTCFSSAPEVCTTKIIPASTLTFFSFFN